MFWNLILQEGQSGSVFAVRAAISSQARLRWQVSTSQVTNIACMWRHSCCMYMYVYMYMYMYLYMCKGNCDALTLVYPTLQAWSWAQRIQGWVTAEIWTNQRVWCMQMYMYMYVHQEAWYWCHISTSISLSSLPPLSISPDSLLSLSLSLSLSLTFRLQPGGF